MNVKKILNIFFCAVFATYFCFGNKEIVHDEAIELYNELE